ncbi:hypothetical protein AB1436_27170, partial (plasmid) [Klebsiella pneumoniae]
RRFHRAGEGLPALCGATPFRARALRRCGGCLLLSPGTRITPRRFHRAGEGLPALCGATPFRARALRRCGGCLLLSPGTRIT